MSASVLWRAIWPTKNESFEATATEIKEFVERFGKDPNDGPWRFERTVAIERYLQGFIDARCGLDNDYRGNRWPVQLQEAFKRHAIIEIWLEY